MINACESTQIDNFIVSKIVTAHECLKINWILAEII